MQNFGLPRDDVGWGALVLSAIAFGVALAKGRSIRDWVIERPRRTLFVLSVLAAVLSAGYIGYYLRGGPRIIDATSYYFEARAISRGFFAIPTPFPSGSFRGRFLISTPGGDSIAVLFPPGYPLLLALGFLLRIPMAIGPLIGAGLVAATYALALELGARRDVALAAALLSVLSAALRYHTADTMSHGFSALLAVIAMLAALRGSLAAVVVAGLACGWLFATRPVTGVAIALFAFLVLLRSSPADRVRRLCVFGAGVLPGLALMLMHQHAATGSFLASTHERYYALADGPPGCFRYGFGSGIGCMFEHGEFVKRNLPAGYGAAEALATTGRRLWSHWSDIANAEPLALVVPWIAVVERRDPAVRLLTLIVLGLLLAYVPFYFDGNYPGGGARFYAEAIPFEHVLIAWGICRLRVARYAPALVLAGFALRASRGHEQLSAREGGRPMFENRVVANAGARSGLVFADTDHGYLLGHVPGANDPRQELVVARRRGDAHDYVLWSRLGMPPAFEYRYALDGRAPPELVPYKPAASTHWEAEAEWPPLVVANGWAHPDYPSAACANGSAALRLHGRGSKPVRIQVEVTPAKPGPHRLVMRWIALTAGRAHVEASIRPAGPSWQSDWEGERDSCVEVPGPRVELGDRPTQIEIGSIGEGLALDRIDVLADSIEPIGKGVDN